MSVEQKIDNQELQQLGAEQMAAADPDHDELYAQAAALVLEHQRASISLVQRHLMIGYNRASRLMDQMEKNGLVSAMGANSFRTVQESA